MPGASIPGLIVIDRTLYVTTAHTTVALDAANCSIRWRHVYKPEQERSTPSIAESRTSMGASSAAPRMAASSLWMQRLASSCGSSRPATRSRASSSARRLSRGRASSSSVPPAATGASAVMCLRSTRKPVAKSGASTRSRWEASRARIPGKIRKRQRTVAGRCGRRTRSIPPRASSSCRWATRRPTIRPDWRPGANLYTDSVVVLDALTGKLKWYHQFTSNDGLDYDFGAAPALYTSGTGAKLLAAGSKDGNLYGIDRSTHEVLFKTPVTTIENSGARPDSRRRPGLPGPARWRRMERPGHRPAVAYDLCRFGRFLLRDHNRHPGPRNTKRAVLLRHDANAHRWG